VLSLGGDFLKIPMYPLKDIDFETGCHYSSSLGLPELRKKISQYYYRKYNVSSDYKTEVLISAGSKVIIYMTLLSLLNPLDEVIIFEPAWVSYMRQVQLCNGIPVMIPHYEGIKDLKKYITRKTKVIIVNSPNNPSGKVCSKAELKELFNFAKKQGIYIISDEAYSDFVSKEPFISMGVIDKKKELTFIVNSLSKSLGICGWRIGYVIANHKHLKSIFKINQHLITCPTTLIELYLIKYFDKLVKIVEPQIKKVMRTRGVIAKYMDKIELKYFPGTGTFYFLVSIEDSKLGSKEFSLELLNKYGISTVPGVGCGMSVKKFLRISICAESITRIKKALVVIHQLINKTKT